MDESGFDTLKAIRARSKSHPRALEAAGFESGQAEAMVTVFGGAIVGNVATKWDVRDLKGDIDALRTELRGDIDSLRTEFDARLKQEIAQIQLSVESLKATMYKLLLVQAAVIVGLILGLQRLL